MKITYTISDEKTDEFKTLFLKVKPVPTDEEDNPLMSVQAWIRECGKQHFLSIVRRGKGMLAEEIGEDLIE